MTLLSPRITLALAAALTLASPVAEATIARAIPFEQKVENAATIVVGRVISQHSEWDASKRWILTYSKIQVEKALKGTAAPEITIVTPGGTVGNVHQDTIGVPKFREGEEHVVFVRPSKAGPTVLYFEQGDYRLMKNDRGDRVVTPASSSAVYVDTQRGTALAAEPSRKLGDFEILIKDTNRRSEAIRMELLERQEAEKSSLVNQVKRNWPLVALALVGAIIATWQLVRRW